MLLAGSGEWQYDTWALAEASGGHALSVMGFYLMQREGLVAAFRIQPVKLARCVHACVRACVQACERARMCGIALWLARALTGAEVGYSVCRRLVHNCFPVCSCACAARRLLRALEDGYPADNPYHNATHAADVLRTLSVLLRGARLTAHYAHGLGLLASYFAAVRAVCEARFKLLELPTALRMACGSVQ